MNRSTAHMHIRDGGYPSEILKAGLVIKVRSAYARELITVRFPQGEPKEWLGSDFEWIGREAKETK